MDIIQQKIFEQYKKKNFILSKSLDKNRKLKRVKGGGDYEGIADIITCLDFYYRKDHSEAELFKIITDGKKDLSFVDALIIRGEEIDVFDIKINSEATNSGYIKYGIKNYFQKKPENYNEVNPILANILKEVHKKHYKKINLIFIREFVNDSKFIDFEKKHKYLSNFGITVSVLDRAKLIVRRQGNFDIDSLLLETTDLINKKNKKISWAITVTPLNDLLKQYEIIPDKELLFFKNIRVPLEEKKQKDILSRSLKTAPSTFHYRHNGIVMAGSSIDKEGNRLKIFAPQVLNGAQTLDALFEIYKENKSLFKNAKIVVKALSVDNQQIIDDICEAANTQKPVSTADIRTNDYLQKNLELFVNNIDNSKYLYLRGKIAKKRRKENKKTFTLIEKESFIQWANSAFLKRPYESKNQKNKLFAKSFSEKLKEPYEDIKESIIKNWDNIPLLCSIATYVSEKIKKLPKIQKNNAKIMDQHIIATMFGELMRKKIDETSLNKSFSLAFNYHMSEYKIVKQKRDSSFKIRNFFISPESF